MSARARALRVLYRLAALFAAVGCSAALPPPARALCYAAADQNAQARVDAECDGVEFSTCASHDSIVSELKSALKECK